MEALAELAPARSFDDLALSELGYVDTDAQEQKKWWQYHIDTDFGGDADGFPRPIYFSR